MCVEAVWEDCCGHKQLPVPVTLNTYQKDCLFDVAEQHAWCMCVGAEEPAVTCMHICIANECAPTLPHSWKCPLKK